MDDLQEKISQILSDPQALEQIKGLGGMLGLNTNNSNNNPLPPQPQQQKSANPLEGLLGDDSLGMITKMMPLLSSFKQEDDSTRLLAALRPFLSEPRQKKLDEAKKMLQLIKLLPLIKKTGIL